MALASWNPVCQSTDSQAAVGSIVVHTGSCLVAELIRIKMQVERPKPFNFHERFGTVLKPEENILQMKLENSTIGP